MLAHACTAPAPVAAAPRARASAGRASGHRMTSRVRFSRVVVASSSSSGESNAGADDAFEDKLSALRGKRSKRAAKDTGAMETTTTTADAGETRARSSQSRAKGVREFTRTDTTEEAPDANWGVEQVFYEGPPARGEVVSNVLMSWTLVWLPLTIQAVGRALWLQYKITDKRVSVISESPLRKERTDVPIDQIADVVSVGRGIGQWGDMVITLRNGEKIELRSLPDFKTCEKEIAARMYKEKIIDF